MSTNAVEALPQCLALAEFEVKAMLTAQMHIGSKNIEQSMRPYIWSRRPDGIHIIDISKTWEKLVLAARVLACIENPEDICVVSTRPYGQRAALKFAHYIGAQAFAGRFTPGTFTNHITRTFREPRIILVSDPRSDAQALKEASYVSVPVIAFADTNSSLKFVDIAIPTNNRGKHAVALAFWLLTREILRLRGDIIRFQDWGVMCDLFIYREPDEQESHEKSQDRGTGQQSNALAPPEYPKPQPAPQEGWSATPDNAQPVVSAPNPEPPAAEAGVSQSGQWAKSVVV